MMIRRVAKVLAVVVLGLALAGRGLGGGMEAWGGGGMGGGMGGMGGGGGMNIDPDVIMLLQQNIDPEMMQQMQDMMTIGNQVFANMQEGGDDPNAFFQDMMQQMQDGTFDQDAVVQQLTGKGYMTPEMVRQMQGLQTRLFGSAQRLFDNTTYSRIRQLLAPTDEEWAVLRPRVQKVLDLQAEVAQGGDTMNRGNTVLGINNLGRMGGAMMRGNVISQMGGPQGSDTALGKAWKALQTAVQDKRLGEEAVRIKLQTWRTLHEKARGELKAAQENFVSVLTLRQEAVMLIVGVL